MKSFEFINQYLKTRWIISLMKYWFIHNNIYFNNLQIVIYIILRTLKFGLKLFLEVCEYELSWEWVERLVDFSFFLLTERLEVRVSNIFNKFSKVVVQSCLNLVKINCRFRIQILIVTNAIVSFFFIF